jgi:antitoxin component of MazEF toxin-antitoxin module
VQEQVHDHKFIARVRRRGKVLEITVPRKLARQLGITHGTYVEFAITGIIFKPKSKQEAEVEKKSQS